MLLLTLSIPAMLAFSFSASSVVKVLVVSCSPVPPRTIFLCCIDPRKALMTTTHPPNPLAAADVPAVPLTTEGYSVLHQMMRFRRSAWRALPATEKAAIVQEATTALAAMEKHS